VDNTHVEIVKALRKIGAWVLSLAAIGNGCPDLLVAFRGVWILLEVKSPEGKLSAGQVAWHAAVPAPVFVVTSAAEAVLCVVEAARPPAA
jgi:hypothetical protein